MRKKNNIEFFRTSAKTGEGINEAFECLINKIINNKYIGIAHGTFNGRNSIKLKKSNNNTNNKSDKKNNKKINSKKRINAIVNSLVFFVVELVI